MEIENKNQVKNAQPNPLWNGLKQHYETTVKPQHLKTLLGDQKRNEKLLFKFEDIMLDLSHEMITEDTIKLFQELADKSNLKQKITEMFEGKHINVTEDRAVLHTALRAPKSDKPQMVDNLDVNKAVHDVLEKIKKFSEQIRSGELKGLTGQSLKNVVVIGIGGSYLSIEFVHEAIKQYEKCEKAAEGRKLRFLANVDPQDLGRATDGLNCEETLVIVNSKTFTTAETILNAKSIKNWFFQEYKKKLNVEGQLTEEQKKEITAKHFAASSTNLVETKNFGIVDERVFEFWDWVGGRFSVWSTIGILPLSIQYSFDNMQEFLNGGHSIDKAFLENNDISKNLPMLLGLIGFYNTTIIGYSARAILPYTQALCKFVPHIQQLDMESNGKRVNLQGEFNEYNAGVINFGEPGTNGQHSFYQLLHQGRCIPSEFIGFCQSQKPIVVEKEPVTNHEELMSNFFSQPDALAEGLDYNQLQKQKVIQRLMPHKFFPGGRPSLSILFKQLTPYTCGQLLAMYEHRTSVEGFLWNINSYDQYGVELGKQLAKSVRGFFAKNQQKTDNLDKSMIQNVNSATIRLLEQFMANK